MALILKCEFTHSNGVLAIIHSSPSTIIDSGQLLEWAGGLSMSAVVNPYIETASSQWNSHLPLDSKLGQSLVNLIEVEPSTRWWAVRVPARCRSPSRKCSREQRWGRGSRGSCSSNIASPWSVISGHDEDYADHGEDKHWFSKSRLLQQAEYRLSLIYEFVVCYCFV